MIEQSVNAPAAGARAAELAMVTNDRRRILLSVLPVVALACGVGTFVIAKGPHAHAFDQLVFAGASATLLGVWILLMMRRLPYWPAATLTVLLTGGLVLTRVLSLFTGASIQNPDVSVLNSIFAYFPIYFTLLTILLPFPRSTHYGVLAWLAVAGFTTWMSVPFWYESPPREGLLPMLTLVWLGYPIFLVLVAGAARRHARLVHLYAEEAAIAQAANRLAEENASRFQGIFNQAAVGIAMLDRAGRWLQVNRRVCEITGYSEDELRRLDFQSITHPDDLAADLALANQMVRREIETYALEKRYLRKDGGVAWVKLFVSRLPGATLEQDCFVAAVEDISQRKAVEEKLSALHGGLEKRIEARTRELRIANQRWQDQNERLKLVTELTSLLASARGEPEARGIAADFLPRIFDGTAGTVYLATAPGGDYLAEFGWGDQSLQERSFPRDACQALQRGQAHASASGLYCRHYADIGPGHICAPLLAEGAAIGVLSARFNNPSEGANACDPQDELMLRTVGEQLALALTNTRLRAELQAQALRDPLTGLYNRRHLGDFLPRAIAAARRSRTPLAVLIMDVDHFKRFNDLYGHDSGDDVLAQAAAALSRTLRGGDLAFRYGGEEFVAVLTSSSAAAAVTCAERIRSAIGGLQLTAKGRLLPRVTLSVGIASLLEDGSTMEQLMAAADAALYRAKDEGRDCVRLLPQAA